ncbi:hypothetical protein HA402_007736 [Bradysia odoriphaga]|nr:hypothetical protein HA402_007736 [Bradysia odoriphaga]
MFGSDDYIVEQYIRPDTCSVPLRNDESADLLGNFDDSKRKNDEADNNHPDGGGSGEELSENGDDPEHNDSDESEVDEQSTDSGKIQTRKVKTKEYDGKINQEQITSLLRGSAKSNRFVLYVTNLNFGTSKERLTEYFSTSGNVKSVRIPKKRKGGFAFVEMSDVDGFKNAFSLHNTMLDDRPIKIQLSEAGKKKSANKKNILKQKNRKLAEMRNETKSFSKSGKNYDKSIKKEIAKEKLQQTKMWERRKARRERKKNQS